MCAVLKVFFSPKATQKKVDCDGLASVRVRDAQSVFYKLIGF